MPIESIEIEVPDAPIPDLVTWLPLKGKKNDFKTLDWKGNKETLISTHPKNPAILDAMVNMISSAKRRVFLFNWMLQYPAIEESLASAANRLNGRVHVLTTLETSIHSRYSDDEESMNNLSRLQGLAGNGVYIRLHPEAHAKFLIVDDELLVTSANIRDTSLEKNIETGIRVSDSDTVNSFHSFFSYLWLHEANQHIRPSKNDPRLGNPWSQTESPDSPRAAADAIWTLDNRRMSLAESIIEKIKSAKKTLRISTYHLYNAEKGIGKQVVDELVNASQRGVEITILYHATNVAIGRPPREIEAVGFLRLMSCTGISMRGHPDLHAKHVIADETSGLLFTANLDGKRGLNTGIEVGIRLSKEASRQLSEWHDTLFDTFPLELVISPTSSELSNRKGTKLVQLPDVIMVSSVKQFDKIKQVLSNISEKSTVICKRNNRWIEPEKKGERWVPKPYESRVELPSISSGLLLDGINLVSKGKHIDVDLSENSDFGFHHAHIAPGKYNLSLLKPYTDDEILQLIEQHLPLPKEGVALKEIFDKVKENISSPQEISFEFNANGFADYIRRNKKRGLLRVHEIKGQKIFPIVTEVEDEAVD
jgi:phosphatidylserine/phosphatidylglycerophosphate/cardiolipin synthase-like enzyme